jgi:hypothetical protein
MGTEKDLARGNRGSLKSSRAFWRQNKIGFQTSDPDLAWSQPEVKTTWQERRQQQQQDQAKTFRPIPDYLGTPEAVAAYVGEMCKPLPIDKANLKIEEEKTPKQETQEKSTAEPTLIASTNLTPGLLGAQEPQSPQLLAQVSAPARVLSPEVQPRLVDPLIRTPIDKIPGTQQNQPGDGPALNRTPVGSDNTPMDPSTVMEGMKRAEEFRGSIRERFEGSLPSGVDGMPVYFLEGLQTQWSKIGPSMLIKPGDPEPKFAPPNAQQMVLVWQGAWQQLPDQLKTPELTKDFMANLRELIARSNKAQKQQPKQSVSPKKQLGGVTKAPVQKTVSKPAPQAEPTTQQVLGNAQQLKNTQNTEADRLMKTQAAQREAEAARREAEAEAQTKLLEAKQAQQNAALAKTTNKIEQNNVQKIAAKQQQIKDSYLDYFSIRKKQVPPELSQKVWQQTDKDYQRVTGHAFNFKNLNDPNNNSQLLSQIQDQVLSQLGWTAPTPTVTKPDSLTQPSGKLPEKEIKLPIGQGKKDKKQGSFIPQPLPEVKPKESEPSKDGQVQPVTSKVSDPSGTQPPSAKQNKARSQTKKAKPPASSVNKAMAATQKWGTDYRANYKKAHGSIPEGSQIHHLNPRAVYNKSPLAQEWTRRSITDLNDPENLEALPQTKDAYDKSNIKIQHSGSHENWNAHVTEVLEKEQTRLKGQFGSLDKVPDDVMKQTKDKVMQDLREDLFDKDLGIEEGWVKHKNNGMDKLSEVQSPTQIG